MDKQECIRVGCVPPACWLYPSMHCWGVYLPRGVPAWGVYLPRAVPARGYYLPGDVPARGYLPRGCTCPGGCTCLGVYLPGSVPAQGGVPAWGCTCRRVYLPGGYLPRSSPPCIQNDRQVLNITLPQTSFAGGNNGIPSCMDTHYIFS